MANVFGVGTENATLDIAARSEGCLQHVARQRVALIDEATRQCDRALRCPVRQAALFAAKALLLALVASSQQVRLREWLLH